MYNIENIHLIKRDNKYLLFHNPSYTLIRIEKGIYDIIKSLQQGNSIDKTAEIYDYSIYSIEEILLKLDASFQKEQQEIKGFDVENDVKYIDRITLHISNDCNLRCKYCYANGGNYNLSKEFMSTKVADDFVEFCLKSFENVNHIVFFGGEPLMNAKIIEYICQKFCKLETEGKIKHLPQFGLITNGTIINEYILSIIRTYISFITVSIDGPKSINDSNRIFINGNGSFDKIAQFIDKIKENTSVDLKYEATYTKQHFESHISYSYLRTFFYKRFGIEGTITDELHYNQCTSNKNWNKIDFDNISDSVFQNLPDDFWNILYHIANKKTKTMCQIYRKTFAVSTVGDIFPCHMDTGNEKVKIGNIAGNNIFNNYQNYKENMLLLMIHRKTFFCGDCWAQNICAGCTRMWFYDDFLKTYTLKPNEKLCFSNRKYIENILMFISEIRQNPKIWSLLLERANNN